MNDLEALFDAKEANRITARNYPYINGYRVSVKKNGGRFIAELHEIHTASNYSYKEVSKSEAEKIADLELDPYNDAEYARKLLDFWFEREGEVGQKID